MTARLADLLGLDAQAVGRANLERAAARALARLGLSDAEAYLAILRADPAERRRLAGEAVVQETWFFRDGEPFRLLGRLACGLEPGLTRDRPLRLLSAPCATGEEPYSMAMALLEAGMSPEDFRVDAADAHAPALETARLGRFGPGSFRAELGAFARYFSADGQDRLVSRQVRQSVRFFEGDILDPFFLDEAAPYAVIFCRNLLLYLAPPARRTVADTLGRLLAPGGLLFTGHAEVAVLAGLGFAPAPHPRAFACTPAQPVPATPPVARAGLPRPAARPGDPARPGTAGPGVAATTTGGSGPQSGQASGIPADSGQPGAPPAASGPRDAKASHAPAAPGPQRSDDARALADAGRLGEALAILEEDLAALGPSAERLHLLGVTFLALGRDREAEEALRKAVYLDPGHAGALTHLELLHAAAGRADAAARLAGRAKRAGGERP